MKFTIFNPFFPNHGDHDPAIAFQIQEVIDYAESRFAAILMVIRKAENIETMIWTQNLLHRELVCFLVLE